MGEIVGRSAFDGHAPCRAAVFRTLDVALELDVENVQQSAGRVVDVEFAGQGRLRQQRPQLVQLVQHQILGQIGRRQRRRYQRRRRLRPACPVLLIETACVKT